MIYANTSLSFDPAYPWSIPSIGPVALLATALALVAITVWTYLGVENASARRIAAVVLLRLAALCIAFLILLRPSLAFTQLDGIGESKILLVVDRSKSMAIADAENQPTRWQQVEGILKSSTVERRLRQLAQEEKIELVPYQADRDLAPFEKDAVPAGNRTDIGAWLEQLSNKHRNDKNLRSIVLFSDGGDNGTRYSANEKARAWRGIAPIHAFAAGNPDNSRFKKDLAVTKLDVKPEPVFVKSSIRIEATVQAPGFAKTDFKGQVVFQGLSKDAPPLERTFDLSITNEKEQRLSIPMQAPDDAGEYKVTLKVTPHAEEANHENNEISTYVRVIKEKLNVLWVDRPRVYEPKLIIQLALAPEERLKIKYVTVRPNDTGNPFELYDFSKHYDVLVIGDIGVKQFTLGNDKFLGEVVKSVTKNKTGLLMLGGSETFTNGDWNAHPAFMKILPVDFDLQGKKPAFSVDSRNPIYVKPTPQGLKEPFGQLDPEEKANLKIWNEIFSPLQGLAPVGNPIKGATPWLKGEGKDEWVLVGTQSGAGRVAIFAGDSTATSWLGSPEAARGFTRFWKQLVFWLANQEDRSGQLVVTLDKRRMTDDPGDALGFTISFRDKDGNELPKPTFSAKVVADHTEYPVQLDGKRGTFKQPKKLGEHELVVTASATDAKKNFIQLTEPVRFLVAADQTETLRPIADHAALTRIASASGGRFHLAQEEEFLKYLDELSSQVKREGRMRTTHWPAWNRAPLSEHPRDQLAGLISSFALLGFLIFVTLLGLEWLLRRMWGLA